MWRPRRLTGGRTIATSETNHNVFFSTQDPPSTALFLSREILRLQPSPKPVSHPLLVTRDPPSLVRSRAHYQPALSHTRSSISSQLPCQSPAPMPVSSQHLVTRDPASLAILNRLSPSAPLCAPPSAFKRCRPVRLQLHLSAIPRAPLSAPEHHL
jgi:hypothetical protein